ncbi:MAG: DUF1684 domain-containing protein [Bacteroidia bacterium]|nr:DUF1684 domain-containing protein [Bacteroidia bacterium]
MSILEQINSRKTSTWIFLAVGLAFIAILIFNDLATNPSSYELKIRQEREQKNLQFKNDPESPIRKEDRVAFSGLKYFPPNEDYVVPAKLIPNVSPDTLTLLTSTGTDYEVVRAGKLAFTLQGQSLELTVFLYLEPGKNEYFVPFRDLTTNVSTYGGGRYMDIPASDPLMVDFNKAYNPYCAYNETFVCPLPPRENKLNVEILAGELK